MSSVAANFGNEPHIYELTFASYSTFLPSSLVKGLTKGSDSPGLRANPGNGRGGRFRAFKQTGGEGDSEIRRASEFIMVVSNCSNHVENFRNKIRVG